MKRLMVVAALLCASCSGGDDGSSNPGGGGQLDNDYSANFTGAWLGDLSMTTSGQTSTGSDVSLPISRTGFNTLELEYVCSDGSGAPATVTSATAFRVNAVTCPATAVTGCSAVTFKYTGGSGTVVDQALLVDMAGSMSGCGKSFPFTMHYTGVRDTSVPTAIRSAVAEAAAARFAEAAARLAP